MAQVPVPEGLSSTPDDGGRSASHDAAKDVSAHLTQSGSQPAGQEQPGGAASLCLSLLPEPKAGFGWAAVIGAARPFAGLALMGVIAPAATIYAAKAAKYSPVLTAAVVGLELALAYLAAPRRAANRTGLPSRADLRGLLV
jgi:hypothetical protein